MNCSHFHLSKTLLVLTHIVIQAVTILSRDVCSQAGRSAESIAIIHLWVLYDFLMLLLSQFLSASTYVPEFDQTCEVLCAAEHYCLFGLLVLQDASYKAFNWGQDFSCLIIFILYVNQLGTFTKSSNWRFLEGWNSFSSIYLKLFFTCLVLLQQWVLYRSGTERPRECSFAGISSATGSVGVPARSTCTDILHSAAN